MKKIIEENPDFREKLSSMLSEKAKNFRDKNDQKILDGFIFTLKDKYLQALEIGAVIYLIGLFLVGVYILAFFYRLSGSV